MTQPRSMVEVARDVKAGKMKLADVRPGIRKAVQRLVPVVGEASKPVIFPMTGRGIVFRKGRLG